MTIEKNMLDFPEVQTVHANGYFHLNVGGVDYKILSTNVISALNGGNPFKVNVLEESSNTRTITGADKNAYVYFTLAGNNTVTFPLDAANAFDVGDTVVLRKDSAGTVSITGTGGLIIKEPPVGAVLQQEGQTGQLLKVNHNTFHFLTGSAE